ncbi:DDE domain-containing protein [Mesorhizobium sp. M7A.F.Ca.CA.001.09.2.1]|nr:DDE domain-containing protein [Mesorhizobium sp. M7A.F.Ca.CA.001.13.2.1]RUY62429.1 DDE domain-containing protein [Mesorhizobium sp. M7A.F.Ca.CA.001.05.1.1]RUY69788.1 DDE domain-containing protein [Mesorhizobium sp. M7A.F.Ca.CA.001.13.1.1]RUY81555.1 DDE domain-containing protein [Mesorhizobium sp. M7A.F.Ca.CA.001.09.2.1]RUY99969.1 DDE domain-containing protein [Mesorhizobium sp. M7A.F.Ca.CA.001.04.2.1]RUZ23572.1 DDE domain-containing protein [Mesorhizobium sp. M7A.F.Ca.CA.001.09.1.1]RUZ3520
MRPCTAGRSLLAPASGALHRAQARPQWHLDETCIKIRGQRMYLYRAASSRKPWSATADRIASSSTVARPIMRRSFPATPNYRLRNR